MWHHQEARTIKLEKDSLSKFFQRIQQETDAVVDLYGSKGSGKSWAAISLCEDLDPLFCKDDVFNNLEDFYRQIVDKETKRGFRAVLLDDFGSELDANRFNDNPSLATSHFIQKSRTMHNIYFITTPNKAFINKTMRERLCDYYMEMVGMDRQYKVSYVKCQKVQVNNKSGKPYYHNLKISSLDGLLRVGGVGKKVMQFTIKQPSQGLIDWYVPYRDALADAQLEKSANNVLKPKNGRGKVNRTLDDWEKLANKVLEEGQGLILRSKGKQILNKVFTTSKLGISNEEVRDLQQYMRTMGYIS